MSVNETISIVSAGAVLVLWLAMLLSKLDDEKLKEAKRIDHIRKKYGETQTAREMEAKMIWRGMSRVEVIEACGEPDSAKVRTLKTKTKEVLKYGRGRNVHLVVTLDNDSVVEIERR